MQDIHSVGKNFKKNLIFFKNILIYKKKIVILQKKIMATIANLKPENVFKHFYALTQIPRPSKHEEKVIDFMKKFGEGLGLKTIVDKTGNVIIRKPASKGMEKCEGIILQAHLDMVPQSNDKSFDFTTQPIETYVDGEWVKAKGTTLGADNGIGVAAAMAVLEDKNLVHGPIECLFTVDEETGMTGAFGLEKGCLEGKILLNLDSEEEGEIFIGCAGGVDVEAKLSFKTEKPQEDYEAYRIDIQGGKGGHSGVDINLGRANTNKLLFRFLNHCLYKFDIRLSEAQGGNMRNAIPRESYAIVLVYVDDAAKFEAEVKNFDSIIKKEFAETEGELTMFATKTQMPEDVIRQDYAEDIIKSIFACPHGVERMSYATPGIVETSNNLAIVNCNNMDPDTKCVAKYQDRYKGIMNVCCLTRSSVDSAKEGTMYKIGTIFDLIGAYVKFDGAYPGWTPNPNSTIVKIMKETYEKMYGVTPKINAIHAGLECALFSKVYPDWDMVSFGPTLQYPHSPDERLNIPSVTKFYDLLLEVLKNAPKK